MKFSLVFALSLIILVPAWANLNLPPAQELLEKAEKGKTECREVVLDLLANIPEIRDPATFESYFSILDSLSAIAQRVDLDSIYPEAVKNLGIRMTASGVRWLYLTKDSPEKIRAYHRWMSIDTAYTFFNNVDTESTQEDDEAKLHQLALNVDELIAYLPNRFPDNRDLPQSYRLLLSDLAGRRLQKRGISEEDLLFWVGKLTLPTGYSHALDGFQAEVLALTRENKNDTHRIGKRLLVISARMRASSIELPPYLKNQLDDIIGNLLLKQAYFSERFKEGEFQSLLGALDLRGLVNLSDQWMSNDRLPKEEYAEHYLEISRVILAQLKSNKLEKEATDFSLFLGKAAAPILVKSRRLEGTYSLKNGRGVNWKFTIALARPNVLVAAIGDENLVVFKNYYHVTYDATDDIFLASSREVDTDPGPNHSMRFRVLANNKIELRDFGADLEHQLLKGQRIETYPNYFDAENLQPRNPTGSYKGTLYFYPKGEREMTLVVSAFHNYTLGRLVAAQRLIYVDLNIGSKGTDGALYLTSGRVDGGSFLQLRGRLTDKEFRGHLINGGRGIANREFVLKKIAN